MAFGKLHSRVARNLEYSREAYRENLGKIARSILTSYWRVRTAPVGISASKSGSV